MSNVEHIYVQYSKLVQVFGEPGEGDPDKVDAEWQLTLVNEQGAELIGELYNYKNGPNYLQDGSRVEDITEWHMQQETTGFFEHVRQLLGNS